MNTNPDLGQPVPPSGPSFARTLIVGEAPGETEVQLGAPFVGQSGEELTKMLSEAGIDRHSCRITNVCPWHPPANDIEAFFGNKTESRREHLPLIHGRYPHSPITNGLALLEREIASLRPDKIIALGSTPLWALAGVNGITNWRGSMLNHASGARLLPTLHPALVLRQWARRPVVVSDLKKLSYPQWGDRPRTITIVHTIAQWSEAINAIALAPKIAVDTETRKYRLACVGVATSQDVAYIFPMQTHKYQLNSETYALNFTHLINTLASHPYIIGQNFLYDQQYFAKQWGLHLRCAFDTMIAQHTMWPGDMPKSLDFMSSLYLPFHIFWKEDAKVAGDDRRAHLQPILEETEDQLWLYCGKDCCITHELEPVLSGAISAMGLNSQFLFQMRNSRHAFKAMLRGCRYATQMVPAVRGALQAQADDLATWLSSIVSPHLVNQYAKTPYYKSPKQVMELFYERLGEAPIKNRKTKTLTSDDDALQSIAVRSPILAQLALGILEMRSANVFTSNFLDMEADPDGRMRCSYNVAGTETFRFSSSTNAFGTGGNLQNTPREED